MVQTKSVKPIAIITGTTASGKTTTAIELAQKHDDIEIINADSILVYKDVDIGSAKPDTDQRKSIPHHLIDIRDPENAYSAAEFMKDAHAKIAEIDARGKRSLIAGGTGFYLKALIFGMWETGDSDPEHRAQLEKLELDDLYAQLEEIDPEAALKIGMNDHYRLVRSIEAFHQTGKTPTELEQSMPRAPDPRFHLLIMDRDNSELHPRVDQRTREMIRQGLVEEVIRLSKNSPQARALTSVGYKQVVQHLQGLKPQGRKLAAGDEGLIQEINLATRQLIKRQRTWFRGQDYALRYKLPGDQSALEKKLEELYA